MNLMGNDERGNFLKEVFTAALDVAYGVQQLSEQQVGQMITNLVRAKLLTADDSYRLQDRLLDREHFDRVMDERIESQLRMKGFITPKAIDELNTRIRELESKSAA